ncbi:MAG: undecaprenyl-diphosphate phosphatase [Bacteroidales bacterium]|nr:undecaprenyl-diphosphate phosphatase [Bacteroidales bacterium]
MTWFEAFILGIIQGLTEFLPVSSSGHLEIGKVLLGTEIKENLTFTIVVHGATVCSTIVVFYKEIAGLFKEVFGFRWNSSTQYVAKLIISCIPVLILALLYEEKIESLFNGNLLLVGLMLLVTALLLGFTHFGRTNKKEIGFAHAFIIGIAQAIAVIPGISRSGATISTGLLLGNKREDVAKFSFLMVLIPIIGKNLLDIFSGQMVKDTSEVMPLIVGFLAAFFSGWLACKWMINIVKRSKLIYFAAYCLIAGIVAIIFS